MIRNFPWKVGVAVYKVSLALQNRTLGPRRWLRKRPSVSAGARPRGGEAGGQGQDPFLSIFAAFSPRGLRRRWVRPLAPRDLAPARPSPHPGHDPAPRAWELRASTSRTPARGSHGAGGRRWVCRDAEQPERRRGCWPPFAPALRPAPSHLVPTATPRAGAVVLLVGAAGTLARGK